MAGADLDQLFDAIRRTRDPELLSALFERTAPWLLSRARLLLGQESLAEDVVQDLFLGLLENGHGCEPGRPCLPYMLGMLHRRAAHVRRREARTLAQSLRDAASSPDAPVDAAMTAEARAAVRGAIDALPEPYREVVRRFVAQQSPSAIGRALGRTPNSVRVQLHRGLRLLRATLPPGLVALLWAVPARRAPAQSVQHRSLRLVAGTIAAGALAMALGSSGGQVGALAAGNAAGAPAVLASAAPPRHLDGTAARLVRTEVGTAATGALVFELRHADGAPAAAVGVSAHPAGRDPDFGVACGVSGADGLVVLRDLSAGPATVVIDRGVRLACTVSPGAPAPQVVTLPEGADVAGIVRDAAGRPAAGAGIWLSGDVRTAAEGSLVARTGADGRFALRGAPAMAFIGAVREGSIPSLLQPIGARPAAVDLVLGGQGARVTGRVLGCNGAPVAGAVVRIARHPRAYFSLPDGEEMVHIHPCAVARTDAAGDFTVADLPPGSTQLLVRAPRHRTGLESIVLTEATEHRVEVRLHEGRELDGEVRDPDGRPVADASVLARGLVRSAWSNVRTAPDGSFALDGLDRGYVELEIQAPGFMPVVLPVARDAGRLAVVLQPAARIALRLQDATGAPAVAGDWELAACQASAGQTPVLEPLEPAGDGFVAAGVLADGPFVVRRQGTQVWLCARPSAVDPTLLYIPAAADDMVPLVLSLSGTAADQRGDLVLVLTRDGVPQPIAPVDVSTALVDFGRVPAGEYRGVLYSRGGLLPAVDLGAFAVGKGSGPVEVAQPEHGWLRFCVRRTDREPVVQCVVFAVDQRGLRVPLPSTSGRVALAAGRYQLWATSLSLPAVAEAFEVAAQQEIVLDLEVSPGKVRHIVFRLPPEADPRLCRARVRSLGDGGGEDDFPLADRGFDTTADGLCQTTLVLAAGEYRLDVRCGDRTFHGRFALAGEDAVAEPIEVALGEDR